MDKCPDLCPRCAVRCHRRQNNPRNPIDALEELFTHLSVFPQVESIALAESLGRITGEDIVSHADYPPYPQSVHDGVAFNSSQLNECDEVDGLLCVKAGNYRIIEMGAVLEDPWDCVSPIEVCHFQPDNTLLLEKVPLVGSAITFAGTYVAKGETIVSHSQILLPSHLALLRLCGVERVIVKKKPQVSIIPVGDDLQEAGLPLSRGKYFESNGLMIKSVIDLCGGKADIAPIVKDDRSCIAEEIIFALANSDFVVVNGGIGKNGESFKDFTLDAMDQVGKVLSHGFAIGPGGKATFLAIAQGKPVIGIPGPPHAALPMTEYFIPKMLEHYLGVCKYQRRSIEVSPGNLINRSKTSNSLSIRRVFVDKCDDVYSIRMGHQGETADVFSKADGVAFIDGNDAEDDPIIVELLHDINSIQ